MPLLLLLFFSFDHPLYLLSFIFDFLKQQHIILHERCTNRFIFAFFHFDIFRVGGLEFGSYAGNPFVGLFWVNDDPTVRNIRIQASCCICLLTYDVC